MYYFSLAESLAVIIQKYKSVLNYCQSCFNGIEFINFKFGKYYVSVEGDPLCLQIYYDDIEVCNPLGAKAKIHKLAMFYYIISNFPNHLNSNSSFTILWR